MSGRRSLGSFHPETPHEILSGRFTSFLLFSRPFYLCSLPRFPCLPRRSVFSPCHRFGVSCYLLLDVPTLYRISVMMVFLVNLFPGACNFHSHLLFLFRNLAFESLFPLNSCSCNALRRQDTPGTASPFLGGRVLLCRPFACPSQAGPPASSLTLLIPRPLSQPPSLVLCFQTPAFGWRWAPGLHI